MFRRILFILVLLGLGFIVWRMINPTGATNALEDLKDLPGKIFSHDTNNDVVIEEQKNIDVETDTVLVIDDVIIADNNEDVENNENVKENTESLTGGEDVPDVLFDEDAALEDALFALIEEDEILEDEVAEIIAKDKAAQELEEELEEEELEEEDVEEEDVEEEDVEEEEVIVDCREVGEIALMTNEETNCCEDLNWLYYRGDDKNAGAICFDAEEGIPQCKNQDTSDEGRYYMDGTLLRKDLDCGDYFGTKYYEVEVVDDSSILKSILQNIFK